MDTLLFSEKFLEHINKDIRIQVAKEQNAAYWFADSAKERLIKIYKAWYEGLEIEKLFGLDNQSIPDSIASRKELFLKIKEEVAENAKCYFVQSNRGYLIDNQLQFCKDWVSLGISDPNGKYMVSLTSDNNTYQIGIRKGLTLDSVDSKFCENFSGEKKVIGEHTYEIWNSGWWYIYREIKTSPVPQQIAEELNNLYRLVKELTGEQ